MKKYIDLDDMVNVNCSNVLNIIQKNGTVSRRRITELSGLSWGGMTKIVNRLLEGGYIIETKLEKTSSSGRIPSILSVNTDKNFVVGLDINKTGLNAIVMNLSGEILKSMTSAVSGNTKQELIQQITAFLESIFNSFKKDAIISVGIAMQGIVDSKGGISVHFPGVVDWHNVPLKEIIEERFSVKVFLEHDPDCLLYAQTDRESKENTVLLRIDKSIGMAAAIDGKIIKGKGVFEIAHNIVVPDGKHCMCGKNGCLEAYIRPCTEGGILNEKAISELIVPLAATVDNMINIFNAQRVILTGALMEYENVANMLSDSIDAGSVFIEFSNLSDNAVKGAALIAVNKSINSLLI